MGVRKRGKNLFIDFRCYLPDGARVRCRESEGPDNEKNRKRVQKKWKAIQYHTDHGTFDYLKFFPHGAKAGHFAKPTEDMTFSEFWEKWMSGRAVRKGTEYNANRLYKNHLRDYFGAWSISRITEQEVLIWRKIMLDKGMKESTINTYIRILCSCLKSATKQGLIKEFPCEDIQKLKEQQPDIEPFTFEELNHLLDHLEKKDPEWHDIVLFWSRTGLRPGEFYALRWDRVDMFNKQILVKESRDMYGESGPVKTESSDRAINLRPAVYAAIKRQQARTALMDKWVFMAPPNRETKKSHQWTPGEFRAAFKHRLRLAGIKVRPPKQLRHTFATLHIGAGESIPWVSKTMGHSEIETTLKRYTRFIPNLTSDDGSAFEKALKNG
ncbi:MAG TPA: hypothetical protein DHV36_17385 [Desulfobacteraceae bacterium]|nr:hypothetical protein [Desulfobacteraceae bacterium]|tara:strand:+ start:240 stop:1385 length:1146 start_codon:yes stop_codon:yes gene_type:complete